MNLKASNPSNNINIIINIIMDRPPSQGGELSKRLGVNIGCRGKITSSGG